MPIFTIKEGMVFELSPQKKPQIYEKNHVYF